MRNNFKGQWNKWAKYLFRELIHTLGELEPLEPLLLEVAESKRGRKKNSDLAAKIYILQSEAGLTARQIHKILSTVGINLSLEGVEYYLKSKRKHDSSEFLSNLPT